MAKSKGQVERQGAPLGSQMLYHLQRCNAKNPDVTYLAIIINYYMWKENNFFKKKNMNDTKQFNQFLEERRKKIKSLLIKINCAM